MLTIIVPTYNRYFLLSRCIQSIRNIFKTEEIIIGDSNHIKDFDVISNIQNQFKNIKLLDIQQYEQDLYNIFYTLVKNVKTEYMLIVEDDDILINPCTHYEILETIKQKKYSNISFSTILPKTNETFLNSIFTDAIHNVPEFWNGQFQFGNMYFKTQELCKAFDIWFKDHKERTFDGSFDEAVSLISIYNSNSYFHYNKVGMSIGIQNNNVSWNNLLLSMYASRDYIKELRILFNETYEWQQSYEKIQLRELQTMTANKILFDDIFNNKFFINIANRLHNLLTTKTIVECKQFLENMLNKYQKLKKYNIIYV